MKIRLLLLALIIPFISIAQEVTQQVKTPSSGATAGNQYFGYWGIKTNGYLIIPTWTNATANRQTPLNGQFGFQLSDSTGRVYYNGSWLPLGGGSSSAIYFNATYFNGLGTSVSPIGINTNAIFPSQTGNSGKFLTTDGTNPSWATSTGGITSITPGIGFVSHTPITTSGTMDVDTVGAVVGRRANGDVSIGGKLYPVKGFTSDSVSTITSNSPSSPTLTITQNSGPLGVGLKVNGGFIQNGQSLFQGVAEFQQYAQFDSQVDFEQNVEFATVSGNINGKGLSWFTDPSNHWGLQYSSLDSALHYSKNNSPVPGNRLALISDITGFGSGTVTSVATGTGLTGGTITTSGTIKADTSVLRTVANSLSLAQTQTALSLKANLASPTFTGTPAAPTASPGTNTTQVATTAFVTAAVAAGGISAANPTASVGTTAVNGVATTYMRSDAAPKADTTALRTVANSYSLSGMQTKLNGYVPTTRTLTAGTGILTIGDLSANRTISADTATLQTVANFFPKGDTRYLKTATISGLDNPSATIGLTAVNGSATTGIRSDGAPALSQAIVPTWTGVHTFSKTVNTTPADAVVVSTPTAAANGAQQYSPGVNIQGNGWGTTAGTSQPVNFRMYTIPVQGTTPAANLMIDFSVNGGAYGNRFQLGSNGAWSFNGGAGAGLGGSYTATVANIAATSTDGIFIKNTQPSTVGTPVQYSPRLRFTGTVWNTTATAATNQTDWKMETRGVSGTTPTSALWISSSLVTGTTPSFTDRMSISDVGLLSVAHITSTTSAPTIAAGAGAGTSPTVTVSGTDLGHQVNVTTGTSPATSATVATVTFNVAYGAAPKVIQLTPANSVTAALNGTAQIYVDAASTTTTVYVIKVGSGGLAASTAYSWYAVVIQ